MSRPRRSHRRGVSPLLVLGIILALATVAGAGWSAWQYWGSTLVAERAAADRLSQLRSEWDAMADPPQVIAHPQPAVSQWIMRVPALGEDWEWPVAAGVEEASLADAVGWYPRTAQPGQVGNFAVAGQCITGAQPFSALRELRTGDVVVVETAADVHTYEITSPAADLTVHADDTWVLDPVPGHDEAEPTMAIITLTTCEDLYPTPDRSVAFGVLTTTEPK